MTQQVMQPNGACNLELQVTGTTAEYNSLEMVQLNKTF